MARILIVDDERDIRLLYSAELTDEGYEVDTAGTGDEAARLLQSRTYDLIVLDIQMKGESGLQILQKIVQERSEMPVILNTAFSCYKEDFSSWLADAYVVKSSDLTELKEEINRLLAKKQG